MERSAFMAYLRGTGTIFVLFCRLLAISAQDLYLSFHHLSQDDGLKHAKNYSVFQDAFGFAWISTDEGLNRFDGRNVEHFTLNTTGNPSANIEKISSRCFEDADNNLWVSTFSGLACYKRSSATIEFFPLGLRGPKDFKAFYMDKDARIWVQATNGGNAELYTFDIKTKSYKLLGPLAGNCFSVVTDVNGGVRKIATGLLPNDQFGLILTDISTWETKAVEFDRFADGRLRRSSPVANMLPEGDSVLWACIYNGLGKYDQKSGKTYIMLDRAPNVSPDFGMANDLLALDENRLLVACVDGLLVFDKRQNKFLQLIQYHPQLPGTIKPGEITALYRDRSDNIWLSGPGGGIAFTHLLKNKFQVIRPTIGSLASALFEAEDGSIWYSTRDSGAYQLNTQGKILRHTKELDNRAQPNIFFNLPEIEFFFEDPIAGLWGISGTNTLEWKADKQHFEFREKNFFGVASNEAENIRANFRLANGTRLVAKGKKVFQVEKSGKQIQLLPWLDPQIFGLQEVAAIFENKKGWLFIADNLRHLAILDIKNSPARKIADMFDVGDCNNFAETKDGLVWAATSKGLYRIDPESLQGTLLLEKTDGCPNEAYYKILPDKQGFLWLTGNNGIVRYSPADKTAQRFNTHDGLLSNLTSPNAALQVTTTGDFWIGTQNGINTFHPEAIKLLNTQPKVQITRLFVNDTAFNTGTDICVLQRLELNYTQNTLSFQFAALDFSTPGTNQYFYRMKGIERDSVSNGTLGFVRYANLRPGEYTFEVWATNSDGVLSQEPRRLKLLIHPPFWQTWWFYLLCTVSVAGLLYAWFWYRLQQALKIERLRVQISSDLHDDVGTMLAGLAMQSEALQLSAQEKDKGKLQRISQISRDAMAHMRDTVWAIDARKDKLENLLDRMREHAEETLTPCDIRFDIQVENVPLKQNLPTQIRQNLYLIYKEAVTNAARHSNGDFVSIALKKWGNGLEMQVFDNGAVAEKTYKTTGLGASNMRLRAEKMGGTLEIKREGGFCVLVRVPRLA